MISKAMICAVAVFSTAFVCMAKKNDEKKPLDIVEVKVDQPAKAEVSEPNPPVKEPEIAKNEPPVDENTEEGSGFGRMLLFYIPNVLLDLSDIFTVGLSVGARAGVEVKLTRWVQFGGTYGDDYFIEKAFDRQIGGGYEDVFAFQLAAMVGEESYVDKPFGTVQEYILNEKKARVLSPSDELYENKVRDFWALGVAGGWLVNAKAYVHPVEIADFVLGLFFIDFRDDNLK